MHSRRLGTNRSNPYQKPGAFSELSRGLPVYEDRHCGRAVPLLSEDALKVLGDLSPREIAPPCRKQGPFELDGRRTQYPQVRVAAPR